MSSLLRRSVSTLSSALPVALLFALAGSYAQAAIPQAQRDWLVALYNSTNGPIALANWQPTNPASDPCDDNWVGVDCNTAKTSVTALVLLGRRLTGTLPPGWDIALPDVQVINLSENQLTGAIPGPLPPALRGLRVNGNRLTGAVPEVSAFMEATLLSDPTNRGLSRLCPNQLEWDSVSQVFWNPATTRYSWYYDSSFPTEACSYTLTPSAGMNGAIAPPTPQTVLPQAETTFSITPAAGYLVDAIGGTCTGSLVGSSGNAVMYRTTPANKNCSVVASFRADPAAQAIVTASAGPNGTISPSGAQTLFLGETAEFTAQPDAGYELALIGGTCGVTLRGNRIVTAPISVNCTVTVAFRAVSVMGVPGVTDWAVLAALALLVAAIGYRRATPRR